ncbi:glycoside hydrolase [Azohydromonas aeria]|uniref:glycoside hydrolase n=1 Tax=Azohydromonas aeria TaxID=2590212 RepID=UPI0012FA7EE6|nr:glycoside hydrolase [Azohydromonas aeria]
MKLRFDPTLALGTLSTLSLALALAVALSACGGGSSEDAGSAAPDTAAQAAQSVPGEQALALAAGDLRVKWHPGHYIAVGAGAGDYLKTQTFKEAAALPNVRGVMTRYTWRMLETAPGVYDFSRIDADLARAKAANRQLFITLSTKTFTAGDRALPDYLHTATYQGGVFRIAIDGKDTVGTEATTGENIALWVPGVRDRLIALTRALGRRYNADNNFEGVAFNETALGNAVVPLTDTQKTTFFTNLAQVGAATRQAFPNTVVMQFFNFPRPYMPSLVSSLVSKGVALGGPDTFLNDGPLEISAYPFYESHAGKVPMGPSVQGENYVTTYQGGPYAPPAVTDLYAFGRGRLKANYMFWSKTLTAPLVPYNNVLNMFRSPSFPQDKAGGLGTACPTSFTAGCANLL